jgi:Family of unknown function (DUF6928)
MLGRRRYDVSRPGGDDREGKALGAKTALLAYAASDPVESLRQAGEFDLEATRALVAATHPAWEGTASSDGDLLDGCYPQRERSMQGASRALTSCATGMSWTTCRPNSRHATSMPQRDGASSSTRCIASLTRSRMRSGRTAAWSAHCACRQMTGSSRHRGSAAVRGTLLGGRASSRRPVPASLPPARTGRRGGTARALRLHS